ncbi:MAG: hypothetical protein ACFFE8_16835 [Candidatus Heimdallarchaeota archaeon]
MVRMWIESFRIIWRQNRFLYLFLFFIGLFGVILSVTAYPGEEGVLAFYGLTDSPFGEAIIGEFLVEVGGENPEVYLFFILVYFLLYATNLFPIVGIWLGGAGLPDEVRSGMADIYLSTSNRKLNMTVRHIFSHMILITTIQTLMFLQIPTVFLFFNLPIAFDRVAMAFFILWLSTLTFYFLTFSISLISLRGDVARGFGGLLFIYSYLIVFTLGFNPALEDLKYANIFYYFRLNGVLLKGDPVNIENILPFVLALLFLATGLIIFRRRDLLAVQTGSSGIRPQRKTLRSILSIFRPGRLLSPIQSLLNRVSPIAAEQFQSDYFLFVGYSVFLVLMVSSIIFAYPEQGLEQLMPIYTNNPIVASILRGYDVAQDPLSVFLGQFYGYTWIYFAPFSIILAAKIINRDYSARMQDLLYGTPVTTRKVLLYRILTGVVEILLLTFFAMITLLFGQIVIQKDSRLFDQMIAFILIPLLYITLFCLSIAVATIVRPEYRTRIVIGVGAWTVLFAVIPYFGESLMPLRFLSLFTYFDLIGLLFLNFQWEQISWLFVIVAVLIFSLGFIRSYSKKMVLY